MLDFKLVWLFKIYNGWFLFADNKLTMLPQESVLRLKFDMVRKSCLLISAPIFNILTWSRRSLKKFIIWDKLFHFNISSLRIKAF